jgi:hypothetical protein
VRCGQSSAMANPLQEAYAEVLLNHIRQDAHPSVTEMNMFEAIAPPRQLGQYLAHLMERIESEPHPSISMMRRVEAIVMRFGG